MGRVTRFLKAVNFVSTWILLLGRFQREVLDVQMLLQLVEFQKYTNASQKFKHFLKNLSNNLKRLSLKIPVRCVRVKCHIHNKITYAKRWFWEGVKIERE